MTWPSSGAAPVALVSGGSKGLGRLMVERLLDDGWNVSTFSRDATEFVEKATATWGERFRWQPADLNEEDTLRAVAAATAKQFGRIDLLVNNAGVLPRQELFLTVPASRIASVIAANLVAPIVLTQACARAMTRNGGGAVVNVSSINAIRGHRGVAVYSAAKAGLDGLTRSLARELGVFNIRVNSVVPGFFETGMTAEVTDDNRRRIRNRTPLGRLAELREIADTTLYLGSPAASFITGQTIVVDGGITC